MNEDNGKQKNKTLNEMFSENIAIAVFPLLGYVVTLSYEYGYYSYFLIPADLISVSLPNVLRTVANIIFITFLYIWILESVYLFTRKFVFNVHKSIRWRLMVITIFFLLTLSSITDIGIRHWQGYFVSSLMLLMVTFVCFGFHGFDWLGWNYSTYLLRKDNKLSFLERLDVWDKHENNKDIFARSIFLIMALSFSVVEVSINRGVRSAKEQEYFYISNDRHDIVYLRFLDDKLISAEYSPLTKNLTGIVMVESLPPTNGNLRFSKREIGPLKTQNIKLSSFYDF